MHTYKTKDATLKLIIKHGANVSEAIAALKQFRSEYGAFLATFNQSNIVIGSGNDSIVLERKCALPKHNR